MKEQSAAGVAVHPAGAAPPTSGAWTRESAVHAELLQRCGSGDQSAFAELYDATCGRLFGLVLTVVRDQELAQEVTRAVYLDLWQRSARYDAKQWSPSSWLMDSAYRAALHAGSTGRSSAGW